MSRQPLSGLPERVDVVVIGGGITGAGVFEQAARSGARVLLVEQRDFASGTSSGSSKLVHGGLRYLKTGQWRLTLESVRERQRLLADLPGLVEPLEFLMPIYAGARPGRSTMRFGLWLYDRMAGASRSRWIEREEALRLEPGLRPEGLLGAMSYEDAQTDDARLTLRCIFDAQRGNAGARNYTRVAALVREGRRVTGVELEDTLDGSRRRIAAGVVIGAAGAWTGALAGAEAPKLRPLRGSHLLFAHERLPLRRAVSWLHPRDRRPVFAYPWEGATLLGTTDVDHGDAGLDGVRMSAAESEYLVEALTHQFPRCGLGAADALSSFAAVRPVVAGGKADPSAESRESVTWSTPGWIGLAGGKLTTFRHIGGQLARLAARQGAIAPATPRERAPVGKVRRLQARLGRAASDFERAARSEDCTALPGTPYSLAELRWSARHESVVHLDDLLLRRTRLGLVAPQGGAALLPPIRGAVQAELGWDDARWDAEELRYRELWVRDHAPVPG